jgi:hypothetical protein
MVLLIGVPELGLTPAVLFFGMLHSSDYGLASFREFPKCLGDQLNRKFMLCQCYAPLVAALVEKAPNLGDRLVDAATFAYQRCGGLVIIATDG